MGRAGVVGVTVRLWLARHGATDWSEAGRLCGWTDVPLNAAGRGQARRLRERLAGRTFASVRTSDLVRAVETARIAVSDAVLDPRLRELNFGELEGRRWEDCGTGMQRALVRFDGFRSPGGESVAELRRRVLEVVGALPPGDHLLFTHGGVIRLLLHELGGDARVLPGDVVAVVRDRAGAVSAAQQPRARASSARTTTGSAAPSPRR